MLVITNDHLSHIDEEYLVEITKPKEKNGDLIISFSFTRTYTFSQPDLYKRNGQNKAGQIDIHEINSTIN